TAIVRFRTIDGMSERTTADGVIAFTEDGQGPPLVLLHAFPLGRAMWLSQVAAFSGGHRVLAPDLRGFGGSRAFDGPPSVDQLADDVAALLDDRGVVQPAIVGGLSMGGYAALAFARRHPGRLRALILADTRPEPDAGPYLARIAVPTLVLVGDEDVLTPPDAARSLAGRIPGSRLEILPGAGHLSNLEQPDAFNAAVRHFLDQLSWH